MAAHNWLSALVLRASALLLALATLSAATSAPVSAQFNGRDPAYAEFYPALDPHGEWVVHPRFGETWVPYANEDRDWRPYSRGQWVYTEEHGWLWDSDEQFGWVVYHYGRWLLDDRHGWMWVPGSEWAPAWVAWREGNEAIGWAPLPPEAMLDGSGELTHEVYASPRHAPMWMFVAPAMLTMPAIYRHFYPRTRTGFYFGSTRHATYYGYRDRRIYNRGVDRRFIEFRMQRPLPIVQVRPIGSPVHPGYRRPVGERRHVEIYRPQIASRQPPAQVDVGGRPRNSPLFRDPRPEALPHPPVPGVQPRMPPPVIGHPGEPPRPRGGPGMPDGRPIANPPQPPHPPIARPAPPPPVVAQPSGIDVSGRPRNSPLYREPRPEALPVPPRPAVQPVPPPPPPVARPPVQRPAGPPPANDPQKGGRPQPGTITAVPPPR